MNILVLAITIGKYNSKNMIRVPSRIMNRLKIKGIDRVLLLRSILISQNVSNRKNTKELKVMKCKSRNRI